MTRKKILQILRYAANSTREIEVTLKRESVRQVLPLLLMSHCGYIAIDSGDQFVFMAAFKLNEWDGDENRTGALTLTDKFSESMFIGKLGNAIENIRVVQ
jgi:hypothetical protein